jgi:hypothetical protein
MTDTTNGAGTAYSSGASVFTIGFIGVPICHVLCQKLFVFCTIWPIVCQFFLTTPLASLNYSLHEYSNNYVEQELLTFPEYLGSSLILPFLVGYVLLDL